MSDEFHFIQFVQEEETDHEEGFYEDVDDLLGEEGFEYEDWDEGPELEDDAVKEEQEILLH